MSQDTKMLSDYINSHKKSLFCGMRSLLAMFTAHNGTEWAEIFLKYNSGTYNNDYFVTDVNKFKRKSKPTKDLVTLIEQLPSETPYVFDVTKNLTDDGFIASFNVPFTEEVYHICQYDKVENTSEYYHPYKLHPRYLISARELPTVSTFDEMKSFARFNNFKRDPYSEGNPMNTIASREDLKGFIPSGAFNQKAVKASLGSTTMEYEFCGAPTNESEDTPTFVWSKGPFANLPRVGLPDVLNFTWLTINGEECKLLLLFHHDVLNNPAENVYFASSDQARYSMNKYKYSILGLIDDSLKFNNVFEFFMMYPETKVFGHWTQKVNPIN